MTTKQKEQIKQLRMQGESYEKIGKTMGLSKNTIYSFCRRYGLEVAENTCKNCGTYIEVRSKQKPKKYCCDSCRLTWWSKHTDDLEKKANYSFTCKCCNSTFTAYGNKHRKYCSHACYIRARYAKGGESL